MFGSVVVVATTGTKVLGAGSNYICCVSTHPSDVAYLVNGAPLPLVSRHAYKRTRPITWLCPQKTVTNDPDLFKCCKTMHYCICHIQLPCGVNDASVMAAPISPRVSLLSMLRKSSPMHHYHQHSSSSKNDRSVPQLCSTIPDHFLHSISSQLLPAVVPRSSQARGKVQSHGPSIRSSIADSRAFAELTT
ncbi:hypothetical protein J1614_000748 [Plenodomus biglobosus]|nr:hypothetical protein J1614_000748 [Plenodomus biglobosus]